MRQSIFRRLGVVAIVLSLLLGISSGAWAQKVDAGKNYDLSLSVKSAIIRKTKRFAIPERAVYFLKTKRTAGVLPHPKNFRPAYAGIHIMQERSPDTIRTPFFSFCRFAPAFRASRYAASLNALYAVTLCALTSLPRKARREPTYAFAYDASKTAFAFDTPPTAYAKLHPR